MAPRTPRQWTRNIDDQKYLVSTDRGLLSIEAINHAFGQEYTYWAAPLPIPALEEMINGALCFGLYTYHPPATSPGIGNENPAARRDGKDTNSSMEQIGFARMITDNVTFAYIIDVYIIPEYQGQGLGNWLLRCLNDVLGDMEHLKRVLLLAGGERAKEYYRRVMGLEVMDGTKGGLVAMGRGGPGAIV